MTASLGWAVLLGTTLGLGLWSLVSLTPRLRRPRLADRVAPYILDVSAEARSFMGRVSVSPLPVLGTLCAPAFGWMKRALSSVLGGSDTIEKRMRQSGSSRTVDEFRSGQLVWGLVSLAAGVVLTASIPAVRSLPLVLQLALPLLLGIGGTLAREWLLQRAATARLARMRSELPTILEFLTLCLSAGEGILDSLRRVAGTSSGELSREFAGVVAEVRTGVPLAEALKSLAHDLDLPEVTRLVDQVTGALDRGSPLAEVLRAQAQDARDQAKRALLEVAGQKEVAMLVPVNT
ncbi:pilus assembly protein [Cryobacterium roopkundense]|uniref:Pilus assembly protein n=1 Tax=Cryobacterium roopkundense TaxID=1001240 RepID=A0A099J3T5_9MICO|nr:type II secretion system F family protein [Cryobacterium roopkundense]KGJ72720.1 pilus assembly protein [Cryobacterium roopkundense]MBB5641795.1 tight adherence protein C [Cryobacterium roopkundense]